jgi:hypothetical protein
MSGEPKLKWAQVSVKLCDSMPIHGYIIQKTLPIKQLTQFENFGTRGEAGPQDLKHVIHREKRMIFPFKTSRETPKHLVNVVMRMPDHHEPDLDLRK